MRVFRIVPLMVLSLLAPSFSAPVEQQADKPLQRAKRTEEVMYGNHQNSARMKKSGSIVGGPQEETLVVGPEEPLVDDVDELVNEVTNEVPVETYKAEESIADQAEDLGEDLGDTASLEEDDLALLQGHKEEDDLDNLKAEDVLKSKEEFEQVEDELMPDGDVVEDDKTIEESIKEDVLPDGNTAQTLMKEQAEIDIPLSQKEDRPDPQINWYDYLNVDGYYQPPYTMDGDRTKRSTNADMPLTAENMMPEAPQRTKRDLTDDELSEWLQANSGIQDEEEYPEQYDNRDNSQASLIERLLESQAGEWQPEPIDLEDEEEEEVFYPKEVDPNSDSTAKLSLLRYIYDKLPDEYFENEYEGPFESEVPLEEYEENQEVDYEPIVYQGVPGIFIPIKPQGPIPDVAKRGSDFYPYKYESSPSGRWDAFMPSHNEEKRNADAYERLYEMARALRRYDDDWL